MKSRILKIVFVPLIYIAIGTILFGNQDLMIVIFLSIISIVYNFLIDTRKSFVYNFLEINGIFSILFIIGFFVKNSDQRLVIQYLLLLFLSFSVIFLLKKVKFIITE